MSVEAVALRHLFFADREASKVSGLEGIAARNIASVGVIGAGTMGVGIAACFADARFNVTLIDQDDDAVARGIKRLRDIYDRSIKSGRLSELQRDQCLARVNSSADLRSVANADLVIEAVFEDLDVKIELFRRLEPIMKPDAILASNTSYLDLDRIAAATQRPGNVIGLHFFSPANVMRLLEIVRGAKTDPQVLVTALAVAKRIHKLAVVAGVGEGFIGNRIYAAYRRQCEFMLEEGAYPEQIDVALTDFGFAMGPFAVSDMSGLDIAWRMRQRLAATRDPRARYVAIADQLCESGRLGQKTGAGWYRYEAGSRQGLPDESVHVLIEQASAAKGFTRRHFTPAEIVERVLLTIVNEAALLLEEGIAARASDIDLVLVNGYGFPNYEGGPLFWAGRQDRGRLIAQLEQIAVLSGCGFRRGNLTVLPAIR
jgi:3-hydroxyacyl-CoA dehydrogenase